MSTEYIDLGKQTVTIDGIDRRVDCFLVVETRPKKIRTAPQQSAKAAVGYGR